MESVKENIHSQTSWPWWRLTLLGLNMIALVLSAILSWQFIQGGSMPGCDGGGSSCDQVLNSRWSTIAGVLPVSSLAVGAYLAILVCGFFIGPSTEISIRQIAWTVMLILVGSIAGSAIWFFILQKWIIGDFCLYCMTAHITGILLTALVTWRSYKEFNNNSTAVSFTEEAGVKNISALKQLRLIQPSRIASLIFIGLILVGILAATQIGFSAKTTYSEGKTQDMLPAINYQNAPIIGSPDAPYIITLLFDYECPHCQKIYFMLHDVVLQYNGKLAFVLCPAPLNAQCNPYIPRGSDAFKNSCELSRIGLAVWLANHNMFSAFENWMFTFESGNRWQPRTLEASSTKAIELVGKAKFEAALIDPWIDQYTQTCIDIYGQTIEGDKGGVPKLIFGSRWVFPEVNSPAELILLLQKNLGLPKT